MTETENLTLHYLRRIDEKVDRLAGDMREVKERLGNLEYNQASLEGRMGQLAVQWAQMSTRIDRMDARLERIERRLEISGPPA